MQHDSIETVTNWILFINRNLLKSTIFFQGMEHCNPILSWRSDMDAENGAKDKFEEHLERWLP